MKKEVTDNKEQKTEVKSKKSSYSKKKKGKKNILLPFFLFGVGTFFRFNFCFLLFIISNFFFHYFLSGVNFFPAIAIALPFLVLALH